MQYHPGMHAVGSETSRVDQLDLPLGASSVPTGQPHPVAMSTNVIPAAVPPFYREYTNVDPLNSQVID